jgi:outer membrane protein TolC
MTTPLWYWRPWVAAFAIAVTAGSVAAQEAAPAPGMTLADAYKLALARSEANLLSKEQIEIASIDKRVVATIVRPQAFLTATGTLQRELESPAIPADVLAPYVATASARITQPLFRRGYFAAHDAASKGIEAAQAVHQRSAAVVALETATVYLAVLRSRELVRIANDSVARADAQLSVTRARLKAGGALKTAEQLAAIEVERAKLTVVNAMREQQAQAVLFEQLTGKKPPDQLAPAEAKDVPTIDQCVARAADHGDVKALRLFTEQSRLREEAARGRRWPTVDLQAGFDYFSYLFPIGDNVYAWNARLLLTIPVFQGGAERTDVEQQQARTELSVLRSKLREKEVTTEMRRAAIDLATAESLVTVAQNQATIALEHYNLITAQFKVGAVTFLDVANAQGVLTAADDQKIRTLFERELSKYKVLYACDKLKL